ncbi:MAG: glycoside hydrolase family 99-like domain-containing protein [Prevotella sp.]|nr:glycoside hydrolase family 99-like domain-containing protein [Prevotella sp.]MBQ9561480.1 glycoside hydrolase family 99-like domain-containing protein [Prevotella sp.]
MKRARLIAYYLPQFHPIPENDAVWGKGFTEWTNVAKAKPLFKGHYQPRIPADLGFYDLRLPEIREQQAEMAYEAGVEGFCYWHYWLGNGKMLLQRPFEEVLSSGKPNFPFCLCWANHSWTTKTWTNVKGAPKQQMIAEQTYPGVEDYIAHFNYCLPAFRDSRYITVDGKPLFGIFDPFLFPDMKRFIETWRGLAKDNGLPGIYFYAITPSAWTLRYNEEGKVVRCMPNTNSSADVYQNILQFGFDGLNSNGQRRAEMLYTNKYVDMAQKVMGKLLPFLSGQRFEYRKVVKNMFAPEDDWENIFPTVYPQWDRSPRQGKTDSIYVNSKPEYFRQHLSEAVDMVSKKEPEHRIIFLKSWNEWAEGNYVEPDLRFGHGYLDAIKEVLKEK